MQHRKKCTMKPTEKPKNGMKLYTWFMWRYSQLVSCCQECLLAFQSTLQPIWEMTLSNLQLQCGESWNLLPYFLCKSDWVNCKMWLVVDLEWNCRLPFHWRNPIGYVIVVIVEYTMSVYFFALVASLTSLALGSCFFALTFAKDIIGDLNSISKSVKNHKNHTEIFEQFTGFIRIHSLSKQLSDNDSLTLNQLFPILF